MFTEISVSGHSLINNWFLVILPISFLCIAHSRRRKKDEGLWSVGWHKLSPECMTGGLETARDQTGRGRILCWSYTCCCTTKQLQMPQEPKYLPLFASMQRAVLELNSSWTWIETNEVFGLDWGFGEERVLEMLWHGFWDTQAVMRHLEQDSGFSSSLSLGRSGPTELAGILQVWCQQCQPTCRAMSAV